MQCTGQGPLSGQRGRECEIVVHLLPATFIGRPHSLWRYWEPITVERANVLTLEGQGLTRFDGTPR